MVKYKVRSKWLASESTYQPIYRAIMPVIPVKVAPLCIHSLPWATTIQRNIFQSTFSELPWAARSHFLLPSLPVLSNCPSIHGKFNLGEEKKVPWREDKQIWQLGNLRNAVHQEIIQPIEKNNQAQFHQEFSLKAVQSTMSPNKIDNKNEKETWRRKRVAVNQRFVRIFLHTHFRTPGTLLSVLFPDSQFSLLLISGQQYHNSSSEWLNVAPEQVTWEKMNKYSVRFIICTDSKDGRVLQLLHKVSWFNFEPCRIFASNNLFASQCSLRLLPYIPSTPC